MKPFYITVIRRPLMASALGAALASSLQGCLPLAVGTMAVGTMAAVDRRTLGAQADDKTIEIKGEGRASKVTGELGRVAVTSYNRVVLLTGEVKDDKMKSEVEQQIATLAGVQRIENDLIVAPLSPISERSNDLLITSKVKAAIIDTKDLYLSAFKVHTERGVVYLMGRVTQREAKIGAEVARNAASKIKKVVTLFEPITEDELKQLQTKPASDDAKPAAKPPAK